MTMAKIAALAGVSNATVSRVVNRQSGVSPETIRAVEAVMRDVGFSPPERRRGPKPNSKRKRDHRIALVVSGPDASHTSSRAGFVLLLQGIESALAQHDLHLNLVFANDPQKVPGILATDPPDGLLMTRDLPTGEAEALYRKLPVVWLMGNRVRASWGDQVMPNNETIGRLAAEYLLNKGHRNLAFLNLRHGLWHFDARLAAFKATATAAGASVDAITVTNTSVNPNDAVEASHAATAVERLLSLKRPATGLFIAEDYQLRYFHNLFQQRGVSLDHGIDLISCNRELPYLAGMARPTPSIDIRFDLIGRIGVERLIWRMANGDVPGRIITLVDPVLD
jgi:DNA-binding LacI/PurR family transcriptional regulator